VWVGIGCGALLVLGGAGAWGVYSYVTRAQEATNLLADSGASISVGDGGVVLNMPGVGQITAPTTPPVEAPAPGSPAVVTPHPGSPTPSPGSTTHSGATSDAGATPTPIPTLDTGKLAVGGPSCAPAAACCRAVMEKTGAGAQAAMCDNMKSMPEVGCAQALATYRQTASSVGAKCP
jgi:hypothetical protein